MCFINAYPHRKKTNLPMLMLMFLMLIILVGCDTYYAARIQEAITRESHPIVVDASTAYISKAYQMLMIHRVVVIAGAVLTLLVPVLRRALRRIDTSVQLEEGGGMHEIQLDDEA